MSYNKYYANTPEGKNPELWITAQKRVRFKKSALAYIIVNVMLWAIYFLSAFSLNNIHIPSRFPWPIWVSLFWGVGLAFHFADAYLNLGNDNVMNEYEKLEKKNN